MVTTPEKLEYWEALRNAINHENELVDHRLTWLLSAEGFLLGGFFLAQGAVLSGDVPTWAIIAVQVLLIVIFFAALWFCIIIGAAISAAYQQISRIRNVWHRRYPNEERHPENWPNWFWRDEPLPLAAEDRVRPSDPPAELPPITGRCLPSNWRGTSRIPSLIFFVNVAVIAVCIYALINAPQLESKKTLACETNGVGPKLTVTCTLNEPQVESSSKVRPQGSGKEIQSNEQPQPLQSK
jgi:hypothetical protein